MESGDNLIIMTYQECFCRGKHCCRHSPERGGEQRSGNNEVKSNNGEKRGRQESMTTAFNLVSHLDQRGGLWRGERSPVLLVVVLEHGKS